MNSFTQEVAKLLSTQEVAEKIGCSLSTVSRLKSEGIIYPTGKNGKVFFYDNNDIELYVSTIHKKSITLSDGTIVDEELILKMIGR